MIPNPADDKFATFSCPYCGHHIEFPAILTHERTSCPSCKQVTVLPPNEYWPGPVSAEKQLERIANIERDYTSGMTEVALFELPCWDYLPFFGGEPLIDWPARWQRAGGPVCVESRFIAPKSHPIWKNLGNQEIFPDALGNPFPPYVNGSGFGWIGVRRQECVALGVIDAGEGSDARKISLLREINSDPSKITLADVTADRDNLLAALKMLREATSVGQPAIANRQQQREQEKRAKAEYEARNQQASEERAEKNAMFRLLDEAERSLREMPVLRDDRRWNWLCDSLAKLTTTQYFDRYPKWRARAWAASATMYGSIGAPSDELACLKRALELNPQLAVKRRINALDRLMNGAQESKPL